MTPAKNFDDCLEKSRLRGYDYGKRLNPLWLPVGTVAELERRARRAEELIATARSSYRGLPPVHFAFLENPDLIAVAFGEAPQYHIAYSLGTEFILNLTFNRLLSDPLVLQKIGDPTVEQAGMDKLSNLIGDHPSMDKLMGVAKSIPVPRGTRRSVFAAYCRRVVADFIVLHELSHLAGGDIEYQDAHFGRPLFADPGHPSSKEEENLANQAFEMKADELAVINALLLLRIECESANELSPPFDQTHKNPKDALYYWSFAICVFCRLWGDTMLAASNLAERSHPPWRCRQKMILGAAWQYSQMPIYGDVFGTPDEVREILFRGLNHAEAAMRQVTTEGPSIGGLQEDITDYKAKLNRVFEEDLKAELRPYK